VTDPTPPGSLDEEVAEVELRDRPRLAAWAVAPVAVVLAGLLIVLAVADTERNQPGRGELLGQIAPQVSGQTIDGDTFDSDAQRGRWVVVNFFASWCPPCRGEHPELEAFVERHADRDAVLVGVAMTDEEDDVRAFFEELGGDWPAIATDTTSTVIDFGVSAPPTTFVIAPTGVVVEQYIGQVTADQLDDTIARYSPTGELGE